MAWTQHLPAYGCLELAAPEDARVASPDDEQTCLLQACVEAFPCEDWCQVLVKAGVCLETSAPASQPAKKEKASVKRELPDPSADMDGPAVAAVPWQRRS